MRRVEETSGVEGSTTTEGGTTTRERFVGMAMAALMQEQDGERRRRGDTSVEKSLGNEGVAWEWRRL